MQKIKVFSPRPVFISNDYLEQAKELKEIILNDKNLLVSNPKTDDEKWDWRNQYFNIFLYWHFHLQYFYSKALDMSITIIQQMNSLGGFLIRETEG